MMPWSSICAFLLVSVVVTAQINYLPSDHIGASKGLTTQISTQILEDNEGNVWIGSYDEVSKYDGASVHTLSSPHPIFKPWPVSAMHLDKKGQVWIIQTNDQVAKETFISSSAPNNIHVMILDPVTMDTISFYDHVSSEVLKMGEIIKVSPLTDNSLSFLTSKGEVYTLKDSLVRTGVDIPKKQYRCTDDYGNHYSFHPPSQLEITKSVDQSVMINLDEPYPVLDSLPFEFTIQCRFHRRDSSFFYELSHEGKELLYADREVSKNNYPYHIPVLHAKPFEWHGKKLTVYDGKLVNLSDDVDIQEQFKLSNRFINDAEVSQAGLLYLGTNLGVYIHCARENPFQFFASTKGVPNSVRGIYSDEDLLCYKHKNDDERIMSPSGVYDLSFLDGLFLGKMATSHYRDPLNPEHLWTTGDIPHGLRKIDLAKKKIDNYFLPRVSTTHGSKRSTNTQKFFVMTSKGLFQLNEDNTFEEVQAYVDIFKGQGVAVHHMCHYKGCLLLGTARGVVLYDDVRDTMEIIDSQITEQIDYIHVDRQQENVLWMATVRNGVIKYDMATREKVALQTKDGLSHNTPHYIHEDNLGRLWIPTNKNLNCINKATGAIKILTLEDGLIDSEFNRRSYHYETATGTLWLGGLNGYMQLKPDSMSFSDRNDIMAKITTAEIIDDKGQIRNVISAVKHKKLTLDDHDLLLNIQLSTNFLYHINETVYSYRIPEISDKWKDIIGSQLSLSKLPYGEYTMEIIADRHKSARKSKTCILELDVRRPFTKSVWFYILAALFVVKLGYLLHILRTRSISKRNLQLESEISYRTHQLEQANQAQLKIFTILAHDLKNPMAGLADINDKIRFLVKKDRTEDIDILTNQTNEKLVALDDNLTNLFHWAVSESKLTPITKEKLSIKLEIEKLKNLYLDQLKQKNLELDIQLDAIDQVHMNTALFQTILRNLISNAIKFSKENGVIKILKLSESHSDIEILISDQGIGFAQSSTEINGTGIGLKITEELIQKTGSKMLIDSGPEGTEIKLTFPKA